jgi:hypothetical protein
MGASPLASEPAFGVQLSVSCSLAIKTSPHRRQRLFKTQSDAGTRFVRDMSVDSCT